MAATNVAIPIKQQVGVKRGSEILMTHLPFKVSRARCHYETQIGSITDSVQRCLSERAGSFPAQGSESGGVCVTRMPFKGSPFSSVNLPWKTPAILAVHDLHDEDIRTGFQFESFEGFCWFCSAISGDAFVPLPNLFAVQEDSSVVTESTLQLDIVKIRVRVHVGGQVGVTIGILIPFQFEVGVCIERKSLPAKPLSMAALGPRWSSNRWPWVAALLHRRHRRA